MLANLHQQVERMWWSKQRKPNMLLQGLSHVYAMLAKYDQQKRLNKAIQPPIPMLSVGNVTLGGSGKTPFVLWLAKALQAQGFSPVLLSRGDGANNQTPHLVSAYSLAREIGDEAVLLHRLSGCAVIAGRDRVLAAQMAKDYGDVIILDDGFQYRQLARVCDIVLVPAVGVGNGALLPAGPLREPISALSRADVVVRSGGGSFESLSEQHEWSWMTRNQHISDWNQVSDAALQPKTIHCVSSIARPQRFVQSLEQLGFDVEQQHIFPDHHAYTADDVRLFDADMVVTTGKDAVKLLPLWDPSKPLWVLEQQAIAEQGLLEAILQQAELS
ncbi:MAG: tetraacyldisaccharide 4'-kinase [Ghiorsea sp.]